MRIISGKAGGIRLQAPDGAGVRPTEDRVKEALFASLGSLEGMRVLDLYSGSGALGLEALSRGASNVILVEKNPHHIPFIEKNIVAVQKAIPGDKGDVRILFSDVKEVVSKLPEWSNCADLILADPPYNPPSGSFGGRELLLFQPFANWCRDDTVFILEHETGSDLPWYPQSHWKLYRQKQFGRRTLSWLKKMTQSPET